MAIVGRSARRTNIAKLPELLRRAAVNQSLKPLANLSAQLPRLAEVRLRATAECAE